MVLDVRLRRVQISKRAVTPIKGAGLPLPVSLGRASAAGRIGRQQQASASGCST